MIGLANLTSLVLLTGTSATVLIEAAAVHPHGAGSEELRKPLLRPEPDD